MIPQKVLYINAANGSFRLEDVNDEEVIGPLDFAFRYANDEDKFFFGSGVLAGSIIPGTRRLIFCGKSLLWKNFYVSTMGGAALIFHHLGINYVVIEGSCPDYSVLRLKRKNNNITVTFEKLNPEDVWKGYNNKIGFYALQDYVFDHYKQEYDDCLDEFGKLRILATGPAAIKTNMGAIGSSYVEAGKLNAVDCWAGRGGIGSKLVQKHKIVAIVYGGDYTDNDLRNSEELNSYFEEHFHKKMLVEDLEVTKKYRYDPEYESGGTLGVNFTKTSDWLFSFNYSSIYLTDDERKKIHNDFIKEHYLKQFNEETIKPKLFKSCGESCVAVCKKMRGEFKKDYEPYEALGPNCGIFDQRSAEKLNHYVDAMGFDAIQAGGLVSWFMECLAKGLIRKEDFGIGLMPKWDWKSFDVVNDSANNAELGMQIINAVLSNPIFNKSIRAAAKEIDKKYGVKTINLAVYNAYDDEGCMVPNMYWAPGLFSPMPIMGKYFQYYEKKIVNPYELGKKNVERMIKEFYSDNAGCCRFHRGWIEDLMEELIDKHFKLRINFFEHHKKLAQLINLDNKSAFWESERVIDIIIGFLKKTLAEVPECADAKEWLPRFEKDKWKAAKEYWEEILRGINDAMKD
ncbi:aldehyde ferredoxin oxidoreductase [Candidatus Woesearchaeota archaeon]|nr:aldehyde ferredoxin oxidoreductase [Candidatus Woesearchaeota archaeon]